MKLRKFTYQSEIPSSAEALYKWHESDAAFKRLVPPGQPVNLVRKDPGLAKGVKAEICMGYPPFSLKWVAEHIACTPGRSFSDKQVKGPCSFWEHQHEMIPISDNRSILKDTVTYRVPFGLNIDSKLEKLFQYRHHVTQSDLYMATHFPLSPLQIGIIGLDSELKNRLVSLLSVLGCQILEKPPFQTLVILGKESSISDDVDTVIHISSDSSKVELPCHRYIRLIPANILWPTFGLMKDLINLPMWTRASSLPDHDVQWISLDDAVYGIYFSLSQTQIVGSYSLANSQTVSLQNLYRSVRSANPLSFSLNSHPLNISNTSNSPSLTPLGAPSLYPNIRELIDIL